MWHYAAYIASILGVGTYMSHFWWYDVVAGNVLWVVAGACAIFSIYGGIITATHEEDRVKRGVAMAAAVLGSIILLGLTLTAIFLLVPAMG